MLPGEDEPEGKQGGVEEALPDVGDDGHPGAVNQQRQVLQGH